MHVSQNWKISCRGSIVGMLAVENVDNRAQDAALAEQMQTIEMDLKQRFPSREALSSDPVIQAYQDYYKKFRKSYHVRLQIESIALKGKPIPRVSPLVEAMFMAELEDRMLTAGHDLDLVNSPISLNVSDGTEIYFLMNGKEQVLKKDDMAISDATGILSSIIYGPDRRTRITERTNRAVFFIYAPAGIGAKRVSAHMDRLFFHISIFAQDARLVAKELITTPAK